MAAIAQKASADYDSDEELTPQITQNTENEGGVEAEPEVDTTLANSDVTAKYQECAQITNKVLQAVADMCVAGATVHDICKAGDELIVELTKGLYSKKVKGRKLEKGVAFPVCISVNECVCHMTPLTSEDSETLVEGDIVKIDMGVHLDGYICNGAHSVIVGYDAVKGGAEPITGPMADVFTAAWNCAEVAARLIKPGNTNVEVTAAMKRITDAYEVKAIQGAVIHQMKRYVIDGNKNVALRDDIAEMKVDKCTFEAGEVYAIDIALTSGEGKPRDTVNKRTTVYKRMVDRKYALKINSSRKFFNEVNEKFPSLPFSLRSCEDETTAKMGVRECVNHELLTPYAVLHESKGDIIAHVKFTVLLQDAGTFKVTGLAMPAGMVSDKTLPEDLQELIKVSAEKKKKNRGNKKKK